MALAAPVLTMAVITDSVNLLICLGYPGPLFQIVTITAVLILVAVHTAKSDQIDMLLVMQCHYRTLFIRCRPDLGIWNRDNRVRPANDVGFVTVDLGQLIFICGQMADNTLGVVTPLAVAGHTLPVISAFKAGLTQTLCLRDFSRMTFYARRKLARRAVMVTGTAALTHVDHLGVQPVVEIHRSIYGLQLIQHRKFGTFQRRVFVRLFGAFPQTHLQTGVARSR